MPLLVSPFEKENNYLTNLLGQVDTSRLERERMLTNLNLAALETLESERNRAFGASESDQDRSLKREIAEMQAEASGGGGLFKSLLRGGLGILTGGVSEAVGGVLGEAAGGALGGVLGTETPTQRDDRRIEEERAGKLLGEATRAKEAERIRQDERNNMSQARRQEIELRANKDREMLTQGTNEAIRQKEANKAQSEGTDSWYNRQLNNVSKAFGVSPLTPPIR